MDFKNKNKQTGALSYGKKNRRENERVLPRIILVVDMYVAILSGVLLQ